MIAAFLAAAALAAPPTLPPYSKAIRCAGLAEAAATRSGIVSGEGRILFDAGMYWGLAAGDAGRAEKRTAAQFKADQKKAAALAGAQLDADNAAARAELDACVRAVPPLKP